MRVEHLRLEDFRNYEQLETSLAPGLNLVVGRNAQGKTNLLEAIYCLGGLGSPRGPDGSLVRDGAERALIHGRVSRETRSVLVDMELRPGKGTRALLNRTAVSGVRQLAEVVRLVFFGPDELSLIKGSPDGRRRFLDELVVKLRPARDGLRREWERVLRQRNALLKSMPRTGAPSTSADATLQVWDESMCRTGAALTAARLKALGRLAPHAEERHAAISGGGRLELTYSSGWLEPDVCEQAVSDPEAVDEDALRKALSVSVEAARARELERGVSLVGPQRDDVGVLLGPPLRTGRALLDARSFASQGDQRTAALALKLAESDLLTTAVGARPILLLDDVLSELDPSRRSWLSEAARQLGQVILSSAEPGVSAAARADLVLEVEQGTVRSHE